MKVTTKIKAFALLLILSIIVFACGLFVTQKTYAETPEVQSSASVSAETASETESGKTEESASEINSTATESSLVNSDVTESSITNSAQASQSAIASSVSSSSASGSNSNSNDNGWIFWVFVAVIVVAFIGLTWWKNKKGAQQAEEQKKKLDAMPVGTEILTIGMIKGKVVKNEGDYVVIETGDEENKGYLKIHKKGIYNIFSEEMGVSADENGEKSQNVAESEDKEVFSDFSSQEVKEENVEAEQVSEPTDETNENSEE